MSKLIDQLKRHEGKDFFHIIVVQTKLTLPMQKP